MVETTHEALLRQTATAEELLAYFQGQRNELQADIATSQAAYAALAEDLQGVVASELDRILYVDATLDEPTGTKFPTIKAAVDSLPARAVATIRLFTGQTHDVGADIDMKRRGIGLASQGDPGLGKPIINLLAHHSGGYNRLFGFTGTDYSLTIASCDISLPTAEPVPGDPWNLFDRTMCQHNRGGHRWLSILSGDVIGGVVGAGLGLVSAYEGSFAGLALVSSTLAGPIVGVADGAGGVFHIRKVSVTLTGGAALNSGGTIGTNFLQN